MFLGGVDHGGKLVRGHGRIRGSVSAARLWLPSPAPRSVTALPDWAPPEAALRAARALNIDAVYDLNQLGRLGGKEHKPNYRLPGLNRLVAMPQASRLKRVAISTVLDLSFLHIQGCQPVMPLPMIEAS